MEPGRIWGSSEGGSVAVILSIPERNKLKENSTAELNSNNEENRNNNI